MTANAERKIVSLNYVKEMRSIIGNSPLLLVGTSVIAIQAETILLQRRADTGSWGYPGGYLELGETPEESAGREFHEETGLIANSLALYGVFAGETRHFTYPNGHEVYCTDVVYTCYDFSPSGKTHDDEVLELKWFPFDALPNDIAPSVKDVIEQYIREQRHRQNGPVEVSFTKATAEDVDMVYHLAKGLIEKYETDPTLDYERVFGWVKDKIERNIESYKTVHVDGVKVGYFCLLDDGERLELDDIHIFDSFQGRGYGAQVLEHVVSRAQHMRKDVFLYVFKHNQRAIALYKRHGFEIVENVAESRYVMARPGAKGV